MLAITPVAIPLPPESFLATPAMSFSTDIIGGVRETAVPVSAGTVEIRSRFGTWEADVDSFSVMGRPVTTEEYVGLFERFQTKRWGRFVFGRESGKVARIDLGRSEEEVAAAPVALNDEVAVSGALLLFPTLYDYLQRVGGTEALRMLWKTPATRVTLAEAMAAANALGGELPTSPQLSRLADQNPRALNPVDGTDLLEWTQTLLLREALADEEHYRTIPVFPGVAWSAVGLRRDGKPYVAELGTATHIGDVYRSAGLGVFRDTAFRVVRGGAGVPD